MAAIDNRSPCGVDNVDLAEGRQQRVRPINGKCPHLDHKTPTYLFLHHFKGRDIDTTNLKTL